MNIEELRLWLEIMGYVAGVASVLFLGLQVRKERKREEYKTLQELEVKYTSLLWRATDHAEIDQVWKKLPDSRRDVFDSLAETCDKKSWPIWEEMSDDEQNCYRFTRAGLEILEQAYIAKNKGWIDDPEVWGKWQGWMYSWKTTNSYVPYVLSELGHWFTPSFFRYFSSLK